MLSTEKQPIHSDKDNNPLTPNTMNLQLIKGSFTPDEALALLTQLVHVKIKFHESKIESSHNEEDIKMREGRIKQLQHDFYEAKKLILSKGGSCELEAEIKL